MANEESERVVAREAFDWVRGKDRTGSISPAAAVGHVFVEHAVIGLRSLLERINPEAEPMAALEYYDALKEIGEENMYTSLWAILFVGVTAPFVDATPANGWSTRAVVDELNFQAGQTLFPKLEVERVFSHSPTGIPDFSMEDQSQTDRITAILTNRKPPKGRVGYFFDYSYNLTTITPLFVMLSVYDHIFTTNVIEAGQFFEQSMLKLKLLSENGSPK